MSNITGKPIETGIIGGSGIYAIDGFQLLEEKSISTSFGEPSDSYIIGELGGIRVAFLPRHGRNHHLLPSEINYRANIYGFKVLGVTSIIGITAVGSLQDEFPPLHLVIPDQLIDRTVSRKPTFFGQGIAAHIPFAEPFCPLLSKQIYDAATPVTPEISKGGTLVTIDGPAFSTRAESNLYRQWGGDLIGMTTYQEAKLAREAEICYAALAMVTDYDCWKEESADEVTVTTVVSNMHKNSANAQAILTGLLPQISTVKTCHCNKSLQGAIMTNPESIPDETLEKLRLLIEGTLNTPKG
ncbi:S-methyl-5'-thioadenosine phosphorylase [Desulfopila sp. IMCC35008]|uniref:S-methyl-5'-thioadenosine phosphorylase n=1 Tax=Desulfopila sp. IMCC35008 TaxID=2653858 RepID=UPI0013D11A4E|nr:S-methyl-5'-thioadenosine phosphorylase [Desulfopila sp. IMCC35008]